MQRPENETSAWMILGQLYGGFIIEHNKQDQLLREHSQC